MADIDVYKDWLGIPEDAGRPPDHYALLRCVQFEDDVDKIQGNYKKLNAHVRKYATGAYSVISQDLLNDMAKAMLCLTDPQRKREYDESQGREFDDSDEELETTVPEILMKQGVITRDQVPDIEMFAEARGLSNRDAVVQMKIVDAEVATQAYARELGLPFVDLNDMLPEDQVLDRVPRAVVKRHSCLPLFVDDDVLLVACADEPEPSLEDDLRLRFEMPVRAVLAVPRTVNQAIAKYYAPGARDEAVAASASTARSGKGKSGKKRKGAPKSKTSQPGKRMSQLTPEEQHERKLIGYIIMLWGVTGAAALDYFVVRHMMDWNYSPLALVLIAPMAILYVTQVYWK